MKLTDCLLAAGHSLRANKMRSVLTSLGIIIGVGAVIAMIAIGTGAERRVERVIQQLGSNIVLLQNGTAVSGGRRGGMGSRITLTEQDAAAIERQVEAVLVAAPMVRGAGQVIYGNTNWNTSLYGLTEGYMEVRNWTVAEGRMFNPVEVRSAAKVAVIGKTVVKELFAGEDPIGKTIRIKKVPFVVIGILGEKGQTPWGSDQDDVIFLPISTAKKRVLGGRRIKGNLVAGIWLKAAGGEQVDEAIRETKALLRQRHRLRPGQPDDFRVRNISSYMKARAESSQVMSILLASVAAISLIVGGIGIMNIMLVSVTERTREIGLRMAVGARGRDILLQFVVEATALALIGGLLGIALGVGGSELIAELAGWEMVIEPRAIMLAVAFSAAIGIFFGFYPARKASKLDPIEALRYE
jgi:putative ABC transport system permease protein